MKANQRKRFDRVALVNRWATRRYSRQCSWCIVGISVYWAGPEDFCYKFSLFGLDLMLWFKRQFIS